jgi:Domain of unknown function (DUF4349)
MRAPAACAPSRAPRRGAVLGVLAVILILGVVLAACSSGSAAQAAPSAGPAGGGNPVPAEPADNGGKGQGLDYGVGGDATLADIAERKIVKTGEITLQVPGVGAAVGELRAIALSLDGYVSDSRTGGEHDSATVTLRIPADRFEQALDRLHGMKGEVKVEATKDEDVTSSIVDLDARIQNLRASEQQYRVLIGRAEKIQDVLAVQSRLDQVRGEIEQLSAQLKQLNGLASLSTITVTLVPASTPVEDAAAAWNPGSTIGNAIAALVSGGQAVADFAIWLLIVGLPFLLVAAIILWLAFRLAPVVRRMREEPAPATEE